jgi:ATP-binding cassette subfamily F protein 2
MYHLHQEAEPSEMTALEAVIDHIKREMERLHAQVCVSDQSCMHRG